MNIEQRIKEAYANQGGNFDGILNDSLQRAIIGLGKEMFALGQKESKEKISGLDNERMASNVRYVQAREYLKEACELIKKGNHFSGHFSDCDQPEDDGECTCGADRFQLDAHIFLTKHAQ